METFICLLNVVFISLIYKYIRKFGIRVVDKYILTSFCILALGLVIRSTINFSNYVIGFGYLYEYPQDEDGYEKRFVEWFHENHPALETDSIKGYLVAVILRNISIGINIARWLITLS
jgi:hypothetical protein